MLSSLPAGEKDPLLFLIKKAEGLTELAHCPAVLALKEQPFPDPFLSSVFCLSHPAETPKDSFSYLFSSSFYFFFNYFLLFPQ